MSIIPFQVTLWIELLAAGLGGLQGRCSPQVPGLGASTCSASS
jgi:hypothetical protein